MTRSNGHRPSWEILSSESNDHLGTTTMIEGMNINDILSSKIAKSSTLNRHQLNKPKSPGNSNQESNQKI